jgi:isopentenyl phosphate kinase
VIILKLGGSLITDKTKQFEVRTDVLKRLAEEIKDSSKEELIVVHGGGSFGHPVASKYRLQDGFKNKEQIEGLVATRKAMGELSRSVINAFHQHKLPVVAIQPSANITCKNGRIEEIDTDLIKRFLELGTIPVLFGDVVLDKKLGFCILSGDQITTFLAEKFKAERVILAADVDGVFDKNPKKFENAKLIPKISSTDEDVLSNLKTQEGDVTRGIKGKLEELVILAKRGVPSQIINATVPGRLKRALEGEEVTGTIVK